MVAHYESQIVPVEVVTEALEARDTRSNYKLSSLKLCIRKYSEGKPSIAQLIPVIFPYLDQLVIHHVHPREFESLRHLADLSRLSCLTVGGVSLEFISPVLEVRGRQLRQLSLLCYGGHSGKINLSVVWRLCPGLTSLTVSGNCVSCDQSEPTSPSPLAALTHLQINTHAYIPQPVWTLLMSSCTRLTSLDLTGCEGLWDESLARILDASTSALANITRWENTLTQSTVTEIFESGNV